MADEKMPPPLGGKIGKFTVVVTNDTTKEPTDG